MQTGIPVVCVSQGTLFGEDYEESLRTLAEICDVKDRAEELIHFINDTLNDLSSRAETMKDVKKPTVLGAAASFNHSFAIRDEVYGSSYNYDTGKLLSQFLSLFLTS